MRIILTASSLVDYNYCQCSLGFIKYGNLNVVCLRKLVKSFFIFNLPTTFTTTLLSFNEMVDTGFNINVHWSVST